MGGGSSYSADTTHLLRSAAVKSGYSPTASIFTYDADVKSGKVKMKVHENLDPSNLKNGIRESRDIDGKNSHAVAVCLDVTGSMQYVPKLVLDKIPALLGAIIKNGALEHPQLNFSAVGDARFDRVPYQVGQFEYGNAIDDDLSKFILEGGGGGNNTESYDLFLYFLARCTSTDCFEKRGQKGYAFLIQDEPPPSSLNATHLKDVFGHTIQADIPFSDLISEASQKWEIFILRPQSLSMGSNAGITKQWEKLFPGRVYPIQSEDGICEMIAMLIAAEEGVDLDSVVSSISSDGGSAALALAAKDVVTTRKGTLVKKGSIDGEVDLGGGGSTRL